MRNTKALRGTYKKNKNDRKAKTAPVSDAEVDEAMWLFEEHSKAAAVLWARSAFLDHLCAGHPELDRQPLKDLVNAHAAGDAVNIVMAATADRLVELLAKLSREPARLKAHAVRVANAG